MQDGMSQPEISTADDASGEGDDPASRASDEPYSPSEIHVASDRIGLTMQTPECDPPAAKWLLDTLERALDHLELLHVQLNILVVDDDVMSDYHVQYCDLEGTTDVLTFDLRDEADADAGMVGDLLLCMDEAARQAAIRGHEVREELLLYAVHGLMHLLGEDDHDEADYAAMHAREDELLVAIGVGRLFETEQHDMKDPCGAGVNRTVP